MIPNASMARQITSQNDDSRLEKHRKNIGKMITETAQTGKNFIVYKWDEREDFSPLARELEGNNYSVKRVTKAKLGGALGVSYQITW